MEDNSNKSEITNKISRDKDPDVLFVSDADKAMNEAILKARQNVELFIKAFLNPKPVQYSFSVKAKFEDENGSEHIWLSDIGFEDGYFSGKIGNNPVIIRDKVLGDIVAIAKDDISDWMFIESRILKGGYTIKALRNGMSDEEKKQFDNSIGFIVEEEERPSLEGVKPGDVKADLSTPEGALLCLENAYDCQDIEGAILCKDFSIEAALILKDKLPHFDEHEVQPIILKTAEMLELSFRKVFQDGGFPSFHNVERVYFTNYLNESIAEITEELTFSDGSKRVDHLHAIYTEAGWKILAPL